MGPKKFWVQKNFGTQKILGPEIFLEDQQCPNKVGFHVRHEHGSETVTEWIRRWVDGWFFTGIEPLRGPTC